MTSCYSFHGQITTDTVEMKLLATMTCEVYCTTVQLEYTVQLYSLYSITGKQTQAHRTNKQ